MPRPEGDSIAEPELIQPRVFITNEHGLDLEPTGLNLSFDGHRLKIPAPELVSAINAVPDALVSKFVIVEFSDGGQAWIPAAQTQTGQTIFSFADNRIKIDDEKHEVEVDGESGMFTITEYGILKSLGIRPGYLRSPEYIYEWVWEREAPYDVAKIVKTHVSRIRAKIRKLSAELGDKEAGALRTIQALGYKAVQSLKDQ